MKSCFILRMTKTMPIINHQPFSFDKSNQTQSTMRYRESPLNSEEKEVKNISLSNRSDLCSIM